MISCEEALSSKEKEKEKEPVIIKEAIPVPTVKKVCVKLPKLESKTSDGKAYKWQEFLDSFESSIHTNEQLSNVGKFFVFAEYVARCCKNHNSRIFTYIGKL